MSEEVLVFHRIGDRKPVHIVKGQIVEWYEDDDSPAEMRTRITMLNGKDRVVIETPEEVTRVYKGKDDVGGH